MLHHADVELQPEVAADVPVTDTSPWLFDRPTPGSINRSSPPGPRAEDQADSVVVFSEIMFHPDDGTEWVELYNEMGVDIDMSRWWIEGGVFYEFPRGTVLEAGSYLVVASNPKSLSAEVRIPNVYGPLSGSLDDGGQQLVLRNHNARIMDSFTYDDREPWPIGPVGSGATLAKIDPMTPSGSPQNWSHSSQLAGSPGSANETINTTPGLRFNEMAPATAEVFWLELSNDGDQPIPLTGHVLTFQGDDTKQYEFPASTLAPGANVQVTKAQLGFGPTAGDRVFLYSPGKTALVDARVVTDQLRGRIATGDNRWLWPTSPTPAADNTFDLESEIVINEIMYHHRPDRGGPAVTARVEGTVALAFDDTWKFNQAGEDLGADWQTTNHEVDDERWFSGSALLGVSGATGQVNNRGDELNAIDGNVNTWSFLTPAFTTGPHLAAFDLESLQSIERIRVAKQGDTDQAGSGSGTPGLAPIDSMNLQILFTTDTGPLNQRNYRPVSGLTNGFAGTERIEAAGIDPENATVDRDVHNFATDGWYSLTFDTVEATGLAILFSRDSGDTAAWTHYPINEIQARGLGGALVAITDVEVFQPPPTASLPAPINTALSLGPTTFYFQREFDFMGDLGQANTISLRHVIDDGAVFYLNGQEIHRFNMPAGPIRFDTPALTELGNPIVHSVALPASALAVGPNLLSVEVHQAIDGALRDDVLMGAELTLGQIVSPEVPTRAFTELDEEWIELYNRGASAVDVSGWSLDEAVEFTFPEGSMIAPAEYVVIAFDAGALRAKYPDVRVIGAFSGTLSNDNERVMLRDRNGNPADEVHYFEEAPWPPFADGGGSSLELRSPDSDNSRPQAWAASDEGTESDWQTYSYRGIAATDTGTVRWNEFILGLLDAGEILLDDIQVIEEPEGAAVSLLQNGDFEADSINGTASKWRILGNHHGTIVRDPDDESNHVLHLSATGATRETHNHAETTLVDNTRIVVGREYEVSFRARWLAGSNQLNTRLFFNKVPQTTLLEMPESHGTPGRQNSKYLANIGPTYASLTHSPSVPAAGESVVVSVTMSDPDGIANAAVHYRVAAGPLIDVPMTADGEGQYHAVLPGQSSGSVVQFYVAATDQLGAVSTYPADGVESRALYQVDDGLARSGPHNFRIVMLPSDASFMRSDVNLMSNQRLGATVIDNEDEIYYDVGIRLKGTAFARPSSEAVSYNLRFPADRLFRGIHDGILVDRSGLGQLGRGGQDEILTKHIANQADGIPGMYDDVIRVIGPQRGLTGAALLVMARYRDVYLESQFDNGGDGDVYKLEVPLTLTTTTDGNPESVKRTAPEFVRTDVQDLGDNKEFYRWNFLLNNNRSRDNFDAILPFAKAWDLSGEALDIATKETMDVDQWLRVFAMINLVGASDTYGQGSPHNLAMYRRPHDSKTIALPWDLDGNFSLATSAPLWSQQGQWNNFRKIIELPANTRLFYGHMYDIINTSFNDDYMARWTAHYGPLSSENYAGLLGYIGARADFVTGRLPALVSFEVTTNDGDDFVTNQTTVTLEGKGWFDIDRVMFDGNPHPLDIQWLDDERWQMTFPVNSGENEITLKAFDFYDNLVGRETIRVTSTAVATTQHDALRITELNYNPSNPTAAELAVNGELDNDDFEFIEVQNISLENLNLLNARFIEGIEYTFDDQVLAPQERAVVVQDLDAFRLRYGSEVRVLGEFSSGRLANGGEQLTLLDHADQTIVSFAYDDDLPWPKRADGAGGTLEFVRPAAISTIEKYYRWWGSTEFGGTPGADGPRRSVRVYINEVLANTSPRVRQTDAIELLNGTGTSIDIGGWFLSDSADLLTKFQIPPGTILSSGESIVFDESDFNPNPLDPGPRDFALSGVNGDSVWLTIADDDGQVTEFVDDVHFGASRNGETLGRPRNDFGSWSRLSRNTLGCRNGHARVGPVVITEVNYHPDAPSADALSIEPDLTEDDLEFIEIFNPTNERVDLADWRLAGGVAFVIDESVALEAGESVVVISFDPGRAANSSRLAAFRAHYGLDDEVFVAGGWSGQLNNSYDWIQLEHLDDTVAVGTAAGYVTEDAVLYDDRAPWPTTADGGGESITRVHPTSFTNVATNWIGAEATPGHVAFTDLIAGDFTGDRIVDANDIDELLDVVRDRRATMWHDLDGDRAVDEDDEIFIVRTILGTDFGDANLDGAVDAVDFSIWSEHRFTSCRGWATADFNGDGLADGSDFNVWNANKFLGAAVEPAAARLPRAPLPVTGPPVAIGVMNGLLNDSANVTINDGQEGIQAERNDSTFISPESASAQRKLRIRHGQSRRPLNHTMHDAVTKRDSAAAVDPLFVDLLFQERFLWWLPIV